MVISLIGPSGCGKSTQAKLLAQQFNLTHYSVGQFFRDEIANNTNLGQQLKTHVDSGTWAPDRLALEVIKKYISTCSYQNFIIDGFPRALSQGRLFEELLYKNGSKLDHIFHLSLPFSVISSRRLKNELLQAGSFSDPGRTDETDEGIAHRQKSYDESVEPILNYYQEKQLLTQIDASPNVETIQAQLVKNINNLKNKKLNA